jgi:hypothetical protein
VWRRSSVGLSLLDTEDYQVATFEGRSYIARGGPRHRLFWDGREREHASPYLMKIPLLKWRGQPLYTLSTHEATYARFADASGVLLHFKLVHDFAVWAAAESGRGEHFANARRWWPMIR